MRHTKRAVLAALASMLFALAGCTSDAAEVENGNARAVGTSSQEDSPAAEYDPSSAAPPAIVLQRGTEELSLTAFTYCWSPEDSDEGICSDGEPPENPPVLGGEGAISLYFPVDDFDFESRFWDDSYTTERPGPALRKISGGWELDVPDELPAIVEVFGFNNNNDVIISFSITQ